MTVHDDPAFLPAQAEAASLAGLVRTMRERALLSQEELARRSGLSVGTVRGLESGRIRRPRSASVRLLADALGLSEQDRDALAEAARTGEAEPAAQQHNPVPAQLPGVVASFTGRTAALKILDEMLPGDADTPAAPVVISAIAGTAGVGKTSLAVYWAQRVRDRFPDGQLYVNLRGFDPAGSPLEPAVAVRGFLDALRVPPHQIPTTLDAQTGLYRSLLADRRMLILLDNARDAEQVRPLLPGAPGCLVIVTSRNQLSSLIVAEGAHTLALDLLTTAEAREFLQRRLGAERMAAEPGAVDEIIDRCARLPLALAVAAARAAIHTAFPLATLAAGLRDTGGGLDAFASHDAVTDVRAVFSWSYQILSAPAARLFRLLCLHPGPDIALPAAASLVGVTLAGVRPLLAELAQAHLVTEYSPDRYTFHDLLRAYAHELVCTVDTESDRLTALRRMFDHYLHSAYAAAVLLTPHRNPITLAPPEDGVTVDEFADHEQALAWLTAEHRVLLAAIQRTAGIGFDTHAWQMAWALTNFFDRRGYWHDLFAIQRTALDAAQRVGDRTAQAHAHRGLGHAHYRVGSLSDVHSHLTRSTELFDESGDRRGQADNHRTLGMVCERQGRYEKALDHAHRAFELFQEINYPAGQAASVNDIGWYQARLGNYQQAIVRCQQALVLQQQVGDCYGQAHTWDSLGYAHHHIGHHDEATRCYEQAVNLFRSVNDRFYEAETLDHLGETHHDAGDCEQARNAWQQALDILAGLGHPDAEAVRAKLARLADELSETRGGSRS